MELVTLTQKIKTTETLKVDDSNEFTINYEYEVLDGKITGEVRANALKQNRNVINFNSSDGNYINGNIYKQKTDIITGLTETIEAGIASIFANPSALIAV